MSDVGHRDRYGRLAAVGLLLAVVAFGACGGEEKGAPGKNADELFVEHVEVNGRVLTCVVYDDDDYEQAGLSCDWEGARRGS